MQQIKSCLQFTRGRYSGIAKVHVVWPAEQLSQSTENPRSEIFISAHAWLKNSRERPDNYKAINFILLTTRSLFSQILNILSKKGVTNLRGLTDEGLSNRKLTE